MHASTTTGRLLHADHQRMIAMMDRIDAFLGRHEAPPRLDDDPAARAFLADFEAALAHDIEGHFVFEEELLFPLVAAAGAHELASALAADHDGLRRLGRRLRQICRAALEGGFDPEDWTVFASFTGELVARQQAHLETEEVALLGLVDRLLGPEEDRRLAALFPAAASAREEQADYRPAHPRVSPRAGGAEPG
jgi:hemerythrin-like domain-containing protein